MGVRRQCLYSAQVGFFRIPFLRASRRRLLCLLALAGLLACSPSLNWRQVRSDLGGVSMLLPCKPDRARKSVPLGGQPVPLAMVGCEAGGATFALSAVDIGDASRAAPVLAQWQSLSLAHMQAGAPQQSPIKITGASQVPAPVRVVAQGQQAGGTPVQGQAVYFARGSLLFQAVIYAPRISEDAADTFFASLKFE